MGPDPTEVREDTIIDLLVNGLPLDERPLATMSFSGLPRLVRHLMLDLPRRPADFYEYWYEKGGWTVEELADRMIDILLRARGVKGG